MANCHRALSRLKLISKLISKITGHYALLIGLLIAGGCEKEHPPAAPAVPSDIVGTYVGHYAGGEETIVFHKDMKFTQKFVKSDGKVVFNIAGSWHLSKPVNNHVDMEPWWDCFDEGVEGKFLKYNVGGGYFSPEKVMVFDEDHGYIAYKK